MLIQHPIPPLFDANSQVLILGSFPSAKSRQTVFFYGHPQNRFWRVLSAVTDCPLPATVAEKKALILRNRLALWDVIGRCEITGSSDSSIRNAEPNDLSVILDACRIDAIYCNGATAWNLYQKHLYPKTKLPAVKLPSTSPANAAWSLERLIEAWRVIKYKPEE